MTFVLWLVLTAISIAASYFLRPKTKLDNEMQPATIDQFDFPTAEEGRSIGVLFGTRWISGPNVVWYGHLRTEAIHDKSNPK